MPLLSIIVPVYKVEKYLERCVESLRDQTLRDIEIILVNDGSPDRCPELCEDLARQDSRIRVVHKKNGGLSSARNAGLRVAMGDYVGFVDSDDTVDPTMFEKLYRVIVREKVDFVMSDYVRVPEQGAPYLKTLDIRPGLYSKDDLRREIFPQLIMGENVDYGPLLSVWHCLYRTEFLRSNEFYFDEEVRWSEDNIFSAIVGYHADSFFYLKGEGLYHYHQNPGTITTSYRPGAWDVYCTMNRHLHRVFERVTDYDFSRQLKLHMIYYACTCIGQATRLKKKEALADIRRILGSQELREAFRDFATPQVGWKLRLQLLMMKYKLALCLYHVIR
jgi:glycosyltransferase involved in cell wall biosynthesis